MQKWARVDHRRWVASYRIGDSEWSRSVIVCIHRRRLFLSHSLRGLSYGLDFSCALKHLWGAGMILAEMCESSFRESHKWGMTKFNVPRLCEYYLEGRCSIKVESELLRIAKLRTSRAKYTRHSLFGYFFRGIRDRDLPQYSRVPRMYKSRILLGTCKSFLTW